MLGKYRKKPVVIEAVQFTGETESANEVLHWINDNGGQAVWFFNHDAIQIKTLEGNMSTKSTDWVIRGVKGEFYPCKDDIFQATYEKIEDS